MEKKKVPAVFTTNQDQCLENTSYACNSIFDEEGFSFGFQPAIFHFHGTIGGKDTLEKYRREQSLIYTLHAMGPHLSPFKHQVLKYALTNYSMIFLGYSGSDPDIWYSLSDILNQGTVTKIYWCIRNKASSHLLRLKKRYPNSIIMFHGDLVDILKELGKIWKISPIDRIRYPSNEQIEKNSRILRSWATELSLEERELAYGWLLVSIGNNLDGLAILEELSRNVTDQTLQMLTFLFTGYAAREISNHFLARKYLEKAIKIAESTDRCRYAQSLHKMGESLSAFESVKFWHLWPHHPITHKGSRLLNKSIKIYKDLNKKELLDKQLGRSGLGNAIMNLGQLYRRASYYLPRKRLRTLSSDKIAEAIKILKYQEQDLRSLPMAEAAISLEDPSKTLEEKIRALDGSIEYAECWNQDPIQVGSAYFAKGQALSKHNLIESEKCFLKALMSFRDAGMKAEIARTEIELALLLFKQASTTISETQGSWEWKLGMRVLGIFRAIFALIFLKWHKKYVH